MKSPIAGVVVKRDAVQGSFLEPNETPFVVADLTELWAGLDVFESDLRYLRLGARVHITVDAIPDRVYEGTVARLDPQLAGASRSVRARAAVPNEDGQLKPGLFVRAAVELPEDLAEQGHLIVPAESVQPLGHEDVVFVERGPGTFEIRKVDVSRRTTDVAEIVRGLSRSERIVVSGAFLLRGEASRQ